MEESMYYERQIQRLTTLNKLQKELIELWQQHAVLLKEQNDILRKIADRDQSRVKLGENQYFVTNSSTDGTIWIESCHACVESAMDECGPGQDVRNSKFEIVWKHPDYPDDL